MVNKLHTKFFQVQEKVTTLTLRQDVQKEALVEAAKNLSTTGLLHRSRDSHPYSYSNRVTVVTSAGGSRSQGEASSTQKRKSYEDRNPYPCSLENVKALVKEWVADSELTLPPIGVPLTKKDKKSSDYFIYHRATRHPTRDYWILKSIFKKKVDANELNFKDAGNRVVRKDPYLNHKEKGKNIHMIGYLGPLRDQVRMASYYDELEEIATSQPLETVPTEAKLANDTHAQALQNSVKFLYINDVEFKRAFLGGASINIITTNTFVKAGIPESRMVRQSITVTELGCTDMGKRTVTINASEKPFRVEEAHYSDAVFFTELSTNETPRTGKVVGVKLPKWEDIRDAEAAPEISGHQMSNKSISPPPKIVKMRKGGKIVYYL
ncbi:hypothetical protein HYC85_030765 [Camellia sinensis]|uniref:Uncharacterized protein n=1 Tax=Camellia sinensis TaxID=4442 RepID=A0A7J7G5I1_CAMSI|nr:hypothetical protein HYC85_030765 [Camellia sinensis]